MNSKPRIFLSPPFLDGNERKYVTEAFDSNYVAPCGPMVNRFEHDFAAGTGIPHVCALSSATAAIDLAYDALGVTAGDTVFCSDLTFVASIAPAVHRGATPVFIDSDPATWTMDPALLEAALADAKKAGRLPKAVTAVDLYGQCCDYGAIEAVCASYGVPLLSDAAEALGSQFRRADGSWHSAGDAGFAAAFSFNGNKIITSSGGGMLASRDKPLIDRARFLSQQARDPFPWYEHTTLGYNYRMSNIVAAIGLGQFERLSAKVEKKRAIHAKYAELLAGDDRFALLDEAPYCRSNHWLTVITLRDAPDGEPEKLRLALEAENIESRPVWKPMHLQPVFRDAVVYGGRTSEKLFATGLCLPSGAGMTDDEIELVADIVRDTSVASS